MRDVHEAAQDDSISLDGTWDFLHLVEDYRSRPVAWRSITVPGPWQAQFSDLRMQGGIGMYRRTFDIPPDWIHDRVFLCFGAVFHITRVWINGTIIGNHIGGFLPFTFDVTDYLVEAANEIKVRVDSPSDDPHGGSEVNLAEIPFGKQSWYGPLSGIWQSVYLTQRPTTHISRLHIASDLQTGAVHVHVFLSQPSPAPGEVIVKISGAKGEYQTAGIIGIDSDQLTIQAHIEDVRPWSPDTPFLYSVDVALLYGAEVRHVYTETFGFRTIETRQGGFFLNGRPLYLRAALDQDYYPESICSVPSTAFLEDQFRKAKELGLNCLRLHIKVPDPRYYEVADRIGLLIWTELPNMGFSTESSRIRKKDTLRGIVDRDRNHPCIICWTIINENWGVDLVHDEDHRSWLKDTYSWLKAYDPGRLVVDNSPLAPSFHVATDIADFHYYAAFPDNRRDWDGFVQKLAARPSWLFSEYGDAVQTGDEPLMCSEFGNWGLPDPAALKIDGVEPWWFETGHDWGDGVVYAHGIEHRFFDWSLGRVFGTLRGFVAAAQWQQFRALKYEIETMRAQAGLAGYVITEFTDVHWESNGLLDMQRNPRVFHDVMATINADTVIVPQWSRLAFWEGETASLNVRISHGAGDPLEDTTLHLTLGETQTIKVTRQEAGTVADLGEIQFPVPAGHGMQTLEFELRASDGAMLARNTLRLAVHACRSGPDVIPFQIWCPDEAIRARLVALGYRVVEEPVEDALWLVFSTDVATIRHVRRGGRALVLPDSDFSLQPLFPHWQAVRVQHRDNTLWRGDWVSTFSWLRRGHAFAALPGDCLIDETFDRVIPHRVIVGCNLLDFQARVHAGMVIGWIHKPVALTVERSYGKGRVVVSTFRLFEDPPQADPTATRLLDSLIGLALAEGSAAKREQDLVIEALAPGSFSRGH